MDAQPTPATGGAGAAGPEPGRGTPPPGRENAAAWTDVALGHVRRAWRADYARGIATDAERQALEAGTGGRKVLDRRTQDLLAWRRSSIGVALVLLGIAAVVTTVELFVSLGSDDLAAVFGSNVDLVRFLVLVEWAAVAVLPLAAWFALRRWGDLSSSHRSLRRGWIVGFAIPLAMLLIPIRSLIEADLIPPAITDPDVRGLVGDLLYFMVAMKVFAAAFPATLSVFLGTIRAGFAAKRFAPEAPAPGVATAIGSLLLACLLLPILVAVIQATGHGLAVVGTVVLIVGLLMLPWKVRLLARPTSEESGADVRALRRRAGLVVGLGAGLLVIFGFVGETLGIRAFGVGDGVLFDPLSIVRLALEFTGRSILTIVFFSDLLLVIARDASAAGKAFRASPLSAALDHRLETLDAAGLPGARPAPPPAAP